MSVMFAQERERQGEFKFCQGLLEEALFVKMREFNRLAHTYGASLGTPGFVHGGEGLMVINLDAFVIQRDGKPVNFSDLIFFVVLHEVCEEYARHFMPLIRHPDDFEIGRDRFHEYAVEQEFKAAKRVGKIDRLFEFRCLVSGKPSFLGKVFGSSDSWFAIYRRVESGTGVTLDEEVFQLVQEKIDSIDMGAVFDTYLF